MPPGVFGELDGTSVADTLAVGGVPAAGGVGADAPTVASPTQATTNGHELPAPVQEVLQSEIGIVTMLNRLKSSIGTAKVGSAQVLRKTEQQVEKPY